MPNSISGESEPETLSTEDEGGPAEDSAIEVAADGEAVRIQSSEDRLIDAVTASQQEALETIETTGRTVAMGLDVARRELVEFVTARIRHDLETQQALLRCRSIRELRGLQFDYLRDAVHQYGGGATRMMRLGAALASRGLPRS